MNRSMPGLRADPSVGQSSLSLLPASFRDWHMRALRGVVDAGRVKQGRIVPIRGDGPIRAATGADARFPTLEEAETRHVEEALRRASGKR